VLLRDTENNFIAFLYLIFYSYLKKGFATFTFYIRTAIQIDMYIFYTNTYLKHCDLNPKRNFVLFYLSASLMMTIYGRNI